MFAKAVAPFPSTISDYPRPRHRRPCPSCNVCGLFWDMERVAQTGALLSQSLPSQHECHHSCQHLVPPAHKHFIQSTPTIPSSQTHARTSTFLRLAGIRSNKVYDCRYDCIRYSVQHPPPYLWYVTMCVYIHHVRIYLSSQVIVTAWVFSSSFTNVIHPDTASA